MNFQRQHPQLSPSPNFELHPITLTTRVCGRRGSRAPMQIFCLWSWVHIFAIHRVGQNNTTESKAAVTETGKHRVKSSKYPQYVLVIIFSLCFHVLYQKLPQSNVNENVTIADAKSKPFLALLANDLTVYFLSTHNFRPPRSNKPDFTNRGR